MTHLRRSNTRKEPTPIELTNLTDLALILVFAGLLIPRLVLVSSADLTSSNGPSLQAVPRHRVTITLAKGGTLYWNRDAVSWAELKERIRSAKQTSPPPKIFLIGDREVPLGLNIDVRTLLRDTDFVEVAVEKES